MNNSGVFCCVFLLFGWRGKSLKYYPLISRIPLSKADGFWIYPSRTPVERRSPQTAQEDEVQCTYPAWSSYGHRFLPPASDSKETSPFPAKLGADDVLLKWDTRFFVWVNLSFQTFARIKDCKFVATSRASN